jgi:SAM-dependent methyltransferase
MSDWTSGYVADIGYTFGYYSELNPLRSTLAFLGAGIVPPSKGTNHCELGFGQGVSINIHAAATGANWYGTDFNPSQAAFAQSLAEVSGANAQMMDQAFAEFCSRDDLPDFDSIGLHGIWSWVSDENRRVIVDFLRRKLKVGGVLYVSYNTLPGWAAFAPMRHLMTEHARVMGSDGVGTVKRVDGAIDFAEKLLATDPLFSKANPTVNDRLKRVAGQDRHYLAHEYFNRDWQPMHFASMAEMLSLAKLEFACSANYTDQVDTINLSAAQSTLLRDIPDVNFRQTVRDFMVNQQFRKDYWIRGSRRLSALEQNERLMAHRVMLTTYREDVPLKIVGVLGEATLQESIYTPILDALSDYRPKTLGEISKGLKDFKLSQLLQAVLILAGSGHLVSVQDDTEINGAKKHTDKLNSHIMQRARMSGELLYLASPVSGGGIQVGRFVQLFLLSISQGKKKPEEWAQFVWQTLVTQGQKIVKDGKTLESEQENLGELTEQAKTFSVKDLPILKALQIA